MIKTDSRLTSQSKTILVVDDEAAVLTVVACILQGGGYNTLLATDGETALRLIERSSVAVDLVLTDVVMPGINGPDLAERILAARPGIKVLFMSGCIDSEVVRIKVLERGLEFLPKPFSPDGLLDVVDRAINLSALCATVPRADRELITWYERRAE